MGTAARGWTAVLLLAAVFLGHGVQCGTTGHAATGAGTADAARHAAGADDALSATAVAVGAAHAQLAPSVTGHTGTAPVSPAIEHDAAPTHATGSTQGHWHGLPGHLLVACLAVLAAGLAMVLVLAALGLVRLVRPVARPSRVRNLPWPALPRPPDLLSLCVLRI